MHIAVLGASRNTGRYFVKQALEKNADIQITILARNPDNLPFTSEELSKITVVKGDALVKQDIARTIEGVDIILCSLGAKPQGLGKMSDEGIEEVGVKSIVEIIKETRAGNMPRLIMVSSTGVGTNSDVPYVMRPFYSLFLRKPLQHKQVAEKAIKNSGITYTIVRPALLTSGELTKKYRADVVCSGYTISRRDVAHFVLEQCVIENKWPNSSLSIAY
ncbi:hypothetical protein IWW36_003898 [Coemansia brasiliensis]|uniref:NAD(P)-binding domain-containing protein n=1 Tax=Coemansia brasiliensis TaxID=2650707 RepID=A0A9W8I5L3_9FUNG|nr:hypothetical protein IWW36_003898 [Coemansia brasiliensis]